MSDEASALVDTAGAGEAAEEVAAGGRDDDVPPTASLYIHLPIHGTPT